MESGGTGPEVGGEKVLHTPLRGTVISGLRYMPSQTLARLDAVPFT